MQEKDLVTRSSAGHAGRSVTKSAECNVYVVGDVEQQAGVDAVTMEEEPWIVGSVLEMPQEEKGGRGLRRWRTRR